MLDSGRPHGSRDQMPQQNCRDTTATNFATDTCPSVGTPNSEPSWHTIDSGPWWCMIDCPPYRTPRLEVTWVRPRRPPLHLARIVLRSTLHVESDVQTTFNQNPLQQYLTSACELLVPTFNRQTGQRTPLPLLATGGQLPDPADRPLTGRDWFLVVPTCTLHSKVLATH